MAEDDLIRRAQRGDREAVEAPFRREWQPVYALVYRAVGNRSEAQDLTQEVFLRALGSLDRYRQQQTPFAGYLVVIARNLVRDRWRRIPARTVALTDADTIPAPQADPEQAALQADEQDRLADLLAPLPPDQQQVIRLRVLEGRSTAEVAALLGRSPGAVRILQHRAITTLRSRLQEGAHR